MQMFRKLSGVDLPNHINAAHPLAPVMDPTRGILIHGRQCLAMAEVNPMQQLAAANAQTAATDLKEALARAPTGETDFDARKCRCLAMAKGSQSQ